MKDLMTIGCLLGFCIMPVTIFLGYFYTGKIIRILKTKYPDVWISLGEPSLFFNNSIKNSRNLKKFLKNPSVEDEDISKIAHILKITERIHFFAFGLVIAGFIWVMAQKH
jgi:hypothetical protein